MRYLPRPYSSFWEPSSFVQVRAYLKSTILETQSRRARQIAETLVANLPRTGEAYLASQIETLYSARAGRSLHQGNTSRRKRPLSVGGARRPEL